MDADEFEKLLVELREGRVDVRVGLEKPHAASNPAVASLLAGQRAERIARGERVAYVYKSPDDGDDDYSIEAGIDAGQARELLAAGAKELGKRTEGPLATRAEKFLTHLGRVRGTSSIARRARCVASSNGASKGSSPLPFSIKRRIHLLRRPRRSCR